MTKNKIWRIDSMESIPDDFEIKDLKIDESEIDDNEEDDE